MLAGVADTHTLIWYLYADPRLSPTAKRFIEAAAADGDQIGLSSITLIEMVYLIEKGRIASESFSRLAAVLEKPGSLFIEIVPDLRVARALSRIDPMAVPDMPDRIIAATALHMQAPIISKDGKIRLSSLATIW
ncbi:MAG TPA: type II toxin-antitoxin system VapC family toxin [Chloroflexota bacterium]|nr:type II toxin-antitoxin system VapC family toxin [Chloroflexota bacterium]